MSDAKPEKKRKRANAPDPVPDEEHTFKYANAEYKKRDPERDLDNQEMLFLIARYQETGGSMKKTASYVCVSESNARRHIWAAVKKNPHILTDPSFELAGITTLLEIADECMSAYRRILGRPDLRGANLLASGSFAQERASRLVKILVEKLSAGVQVGSREEAKEAIGAIDDDLKRFGHSTAGADAKKPEAEAAATDGMGTDARPEGDNGT